MKKNQNLAHSVLTQGGFTQVSRDLRKKLGMYPSHLLHHLMDIHKNYFKGLDEFYQQESRLAEEFDISERSVNKFLHFLKDKEILNITKKGIPMRNYYKINYNKIIEILSEDE